jgi:hypothetical protein
MPYLYAILAVLIAINWAMGDEPLTTSLSAAECAAGCYILPIGE